MAIPRKLTYTEADYYALPEDVRAELIDGQIYYQAAPSRIQKAAPAKSIRLHLPLNYGKIRKPLLNLI